VRSISVLRGLDGALPNADVGPILLSVIPGLGQWRMGRPRLAAMLCGAWLVAILLAIATTGTTIGWFCRMTVVAVHCLAINLLLMRDLQGMSTVRRALFGFGIYVCVVMFVYLPVLAAVGRVGSVVRVEQMAANESLETGDVVLCGGAWTNPNQWRVGHIVSYRTRIAGMAGYRLDAGENIDRIVGLAGDLIEIRSGRLFVNQVEPSPEHLPLAPLTGVPDATAYCPTGSVVIVPSAMVVQRVTANGTVDVRWATPQLLFVPFDSVRGRLIVRLRPLSRFGRIDDGSMTRMVGGPARRDLPGAHARSLDQGSGL